MFLGYSLEESLLTLDENKKKFLEGNRFKCFNLFSFLNL